MLREDPELHDYSADEMEQASAVTELLLKNSLREQAARSGPETHERFDGLHCVEEDCGADLPAERLALKRVRCVECQTLLDKRRAQYRR